MYAEEKNWKEMQMQQQLVVDGIQEDSSYVSVFPKFSNINMNLIL